jgi:NAD(P)-dependent dehydrogenase (short-subunit alcohol dehydrogenase family)
MTDKGRAMPDISLEGRVALVTGATGGWGSGAAVALASRGASVVLNSRTQATLDTFAERLRATGATAVGMAADVTTLEGATRLVEQVTEQYGRLDILVNSAGMRRTDGAGATPDDSHGMYGGGLLGMSQASWDATIASELTMIFACTKAAAVQMVAQGGGGAIVTVVGNILGAPGESAHAAAKSAVLGCIWSWSDELKAHGITVNGVRGYVRSLLTDPEFDVSVYDFETGRGAGTLPTEPADAGEIVAWLASPDAADITGTYLGLDGPRLTVWEPKLPDTAVFRDPAWTVEDLARSVGPILRRRGRRPSMTDQLMDMFSARDRTRAAATPYAVEASSSSTSASAAGRDRNGE